MTTIDVTSKGEGRIYSVALDETFPEGQQWRLKLGEYVWGPGFATEAEAQQQKDEHDRSANHTSDHVLRFNGKRFGLCIVKPGHEGRQEFQQPLVPGPWAQPFGLATVIDNHGGTAAESAKLVAQGLEHEASYGDRLRIKHPDETVDVYYLVNSTPKRKGLLNFVLATKSLLVCPSCGYYGQREAENRGTFRLLSDGTLWRDIVSVDDGVVTANGRSEMYDEEEKNDRFECRNCMAEFPIPDGIELEYS